MRRGRAARCVLNVIKRIVERGDDKQIRHRTKSPSSDAPMLASSQARARTMTITAGRSRLLDNPAEMKLVVSALPYVTDVAKRRARPACSTSDVVGFDGDATNGHRIISTPYARRHAFDVRLAVRNVRHGDRRAARHVTQARTHARTPGRRPECHAVESRAVAVDRSTTRTSRCSCDERASTSALIYRASVRAATSRNRDVYERHAISNELRRVSIHIRAPSSVLRCHGDI